MNRQPSRRYQIWALADTKSPVERARVPESLVDSREGEATLYHYGLPIEIELPGLCTLPNGRSMACKTKKISSESVNFIYDLSGTGYRFKLPNDMPAGSTMHIDLDRIGEFHGALTLQNADGFQIAVDGEYKNILSNRLALLATTIRNVGLDDGTGTVKPSITRLEPDTKGCRFTDYTGVVRKGAVINVSQVDALIKAAVIPPVGSHIVFGGPRSYAAEVTRVFEIGFAVKFCPPIPENEFSAAIKFLNE
jgi:hypothetical protein